MKSIAFALIATVSIGTSPHASHAELRRAWWPNGQPRSMVQVTRGVYHGEYRTWRDNGQPYELKHFVDGREQGSQQAWDDSGALYLNYVVRGGRRYGFINAQPCLPPDVDGTSKAVQP